VPRTDRLFFMDVLRHLAEGREAEMLGPSSAPSDSAQLGVQDDSPQYLDAEMSQTPATRTHGRHARRHHRRRARRRGASFTG
jgi:acyl-homoserine lactone acylase PvdQ